MKLLTRHFGLARLPRAATESDTLNYLLVRALRSQGIVSLDSACHLDTPRKPAMAKLIAARVRRKELVAVRLEGAEKVPHWMRPDALDETREPGEEQVHILSPFDPLIIQRKRLKMFFDYEYRFEAYVPKEKRVFGYFLCPVLVGDRIVAALDLKTDRQKGKLLVQKWNWVGRRSKADRTKVEEALEQFEDFQVNRVSGKR